MGDIGKLHQAGQNGRPLPEPVKHATRLCCSDLSWLRSRQQCYHILHRPTLQGPSGDCTHVCVCLGKISCELYCICVYALRLALRHTHTHTHTGTYKLTLERKGHDWSVRLDLGCFHLSCIMSGGTVVIQCGASQPLCYDLRACECCR